MRQSLAGWNPKAAKQTLPWAQLLDAWHRQDTDAFAKATDSLQTVQQNIAPTVTGKAALEATSDRLNLNIGASGCFILALLGVFAGWLLTGQKGDHARRIAAGALAAGALGMTTMLVLRVIITGKPPVTNLYSSAVLVGFGIAWLGLLLDWIFARLLRLNLGLGLLVGALAGFAALRIAFALQLGGDQRGPLQAVLDTPFWLSTHVLMITLGYSATFLAGLLGIVSILGGVCTRTLGKDGLRALERATYGVVCFALLLSFIGTVLGGIWGDQSWGRFWGWDPKENGAMMIVIWNAIILHARWGGWARIRGMAILAVLGNIITAWSWFGVNQLGIGLHSYGFTDAATKALLIFVGSQVFVVAVGLLPSSDWRSLKRI